MVAMLSSPADLAMLLLLALLLFGAKRLPEIARSLGTGMREFKDSIEGVTKSEPSPPAAMGPTDLQRAANPGQSTGAAAAADRESATPS
jgi:sec-independent protein translocase protein TatA